MTGRKLLKRQKLRNNEYYDMQSVFDELYKNSLAEREFKNLISIITTEENIRLEPVLKSGSCVQSANMVNS